MKMQLHVLGMRCFNDTVEGQKYDFTKMNVVMDMPDKPNMRGKNAVEIAFGDSSNFEKLKDAAFPGDFDLDLNITSKGYEILDAKPVAKPQAVRPAQVG
jgi:hypothetical protein